MKAAIDAAIALIGGWRAALFLALAIAFGIAAGVTGFRLKLSEAHVGKLEAEAVNWKDANDANRFTIETLTERINGMVEERRLQRDAQQAAILAGLEREARITQELGKTRQELKDAYRRSPTARAWGSAGVDADVARRLPGMPD